MNEEFLGALSEIVKEKGISVEALLETIDDAIIAAYKKKTFQIQEQLHKM